VAYYPHRQHPAVAKPSPPSSVPISDDRRPGQPSQVLRYHGGRDAIRERLTEIDPPAAIRRV
jgi:hypothetical protein